MAGELSLPFSTGVDIEALIRDLAGVAVGSANLADSGGGLYLGDFPTSITVSGTYKVLYRDTSDNTPVGGDTIHWDGVKEVTLLNVDSKIASTIAPDFSAITTDLTAISAILDDIRKGFYNRMLIDETTNELIIYEDDETTVFKKFDLKDISGGPASDDIYEVDPQ